MVNGGATLSGEMLGKGYGFRSASRLIGVVLHDSWAITPHLRKERPHRLKKPPAFYLTNVTVRCVLPKSIGLVSMTIYYWEASSIVVERLLEMRISEWCDVCGGGCGVF